jgi:hypothetical protein
MGASIIYKNTLRLCDLITLTNYRDRPLISIRLIRRTMVSVRVRPWGAFLRRNENEGSG